MKNEAVERSVSLDDPRSSVLTASTLRQPLHGYRISDSESSSNKHVEFKSHRANSACSAQALIYTCVLVICFSTNFIGYFWYQFYTRQPCIFNHDSPNPSCKNCTFMNPIHRCIVQWSEAGGNKLDVLVHTTVAKESLRRGHMLVFRARDVMPDQLYVFFTQRLEQNAYVNGTMYFMDLPSNTTEFEQMYRMLKGGPHNLPNRSKYPFVASWNTQTDEAEYRIMFRLEFDANSYGVLECKNESYCQKGISQWHIIKYGTLKQADNPEFSHETRFDVISFYMNQKNFDVEEAHINFQVDCTIQKMIATNAIIW